MNNRRLRLVAAWDPTAMDKAARAAASKSPLLDDLRDELAHQRAEVERAQADLDRRQAAINARSARIEELADRGLFGGKFERSVVERAAKTTGASKVEVVLLLADALDAMATTTGADK